jgi:hypothetical protein
MHRTTTTDLEGISYQAMSLLNLVVVFVVVATPEGNICCVSAFVFENNPIVQLYQTRKKYKVMEELM